VLFGWVTLHWRSCIEFSSGVQISLHTSKQTKKWKICFSCFKITFTSRLAQSYGTSCTITYTKIAGALTVFQPSVNDLWLTHSCSKVKSSLIGTPKYKECSTSTGVADCWIEWQRSSRIKCHSITLHCPPLFTSWKKLKNLNRVVQWIKICGCLLAIVVYKENERQLSAVSLNFRLKMKAKQNKHISLPCKIYQNKLI